MMIFSQEDIERANSASLTGVARDLGFTIKRVGNCYTTKEIDSLRIYNDRTWHRFSGITREKNGGGAINFVIEFANLGFQEAVTWILDRYNILPSYPTVEKLEEKNHVFQLPEANKDNRRLFAYLHKIRGISIPVIEFVLKKHIMYESRNHHNIIFVGEDRDGVPKFASMRGTNDSVRIFKCDVPGNDKRYGFNIMGTNDTLVIVEGGIDALSYIELTQDYDSNLLANGMVTSFAPIDTFLKENPHIKTLIPVFDHDTAGYEATEKFYAIYGEKYNIDDFEYAKEKNDLNDCVRDEEKEQEIVKRPIR